VNQTKIANRNQRYNFDPVSTISFPSPNISVENTFRWKRVRSILDNMFKF